MKHVTLVLNKFVAGKAGNKFLGYPELPQIPLKGDGIYFKGVSYVVTGQPYYYIDEHRGCETFITVEPI